MDITLTLSAQKVGILRSALDAMNKAGGLSLGDSMMLVSLSNELQMAIEGADKPAAKGKK